MLRIAIPLMTLTAIDGICSGLRASFGRSGLIHHQPQDRRSAALGLVAVLILLIPAGGSFLVAVMALGTPWAAYLSAGRAMLAVLLPYASIVGLALAAYGLLSWRKRYLAMAIILGPCTLIRPVVAVGAVIAGALASGRWTAACTLVLGLIAVLTVERLVGRLHQRDRTASRHRSTSQP